MAQDSMAAVGKKETMVEVRLRVGLMNNGFNIKSKGIWSLMYVVFDVYNMNEVLSSAAELI